MSEEHVIPEAPEVETTEVIEEVQEEIVDSVESPVVEDEPQKVDTETEEDAVESALKRQKELEEQLKALEDTDVNIFEKNAILEKKLEDAKRLKEAEERNKELEAQLENIKKQSLIDGMIAGGQLTKDLKEWADGLSYDQLQTFSKTAPRQKKVTEQKNPVGDEVTLDMEEWRKKMNKSRIIS